MKNPCKMDYGGGIQMDELYSENYYQNNCGNDYSDKKIWMDFFGNIADNIIRDFAPTTVLDVGCAFGYLVEALRDRGIEAYGIDISDYAIKNVRNDLQEYCNAQPLLNDLPDNFPKHFDIVTNIEVLEHIPEEDCEKSLQKLCGYSDTIIFSSSAEDIYEPTHINVQQPEYWASRFAKLGFYNNINYSVDYISPFARCFKKEENFSKIVERYEHKIRLIKYDLNNKTQKAFGVNYNSNLYYDTGSGFNPEEISEFHFDSESVFIEFNLKPNTQKIRFDPIESAGCIVKDLKVLSNKGIVNEDKVYPLNGIKLKDFYVFIDTDPQMMIDINSNDADWIKIKAVVLPLKSFEWLEVFDEYIKEMGLSESRNKEITKNNAVIEEKNKAIIEAEYSLFEADKEIYDLKCESEEKDIEIEYLCSNVYGHYKELVKYKEHYNAAMNQLQDMNINYNNVKTAYDVMSNSASWKITKPARAVLDFIKKILKSNRATHMFCKGLKSIKNNGIKATYKKVRKKLSESKAINSYVTANKLSEKEIQKQKNTKFSKKVKFSIVVPLYNTPEQFLKEMIESVISQTYSNWELCMADGSDKDHKYVGEICRQYAKKDSRVKYKKLKENLGISENTNACIKMSTGEYIGLLDHDDLLHPGALYYVMKEICENDADMIYSDEATFKGDIDNLVVVHYKPDYAIDNLRVCNYICHFTVFGRSVLMKLDKWFDSNYNGSQDHEITLRLVEKSDNVCHIPRILYYWRSHDGSTAGGDGALQKPYAITAGINAVLDNIRSHGYNGTAESIWVCPSFYRIHYDLISKPLVSIIILNKDNASVLKTCIDSILSKTTYENYEIIIVENNSTEKETFDYYSSIESQHNNIKIVWWKEKGFNYATLNNFGAEFADGEQLILLNNDTEVITGDWIEQMLMFSQRDDVGMVGVKLYYPDDTIQHAGVIMGLGKDRLAGHIFLGANKNEVGYMGRLWFPQNLSAVTGACVMVKRKIFDEVGGLSTEFKNSFCDIDLCLKIREKDYLIVWTPWAELYHYESKSRGSMLTKDKQAAFEREIAQFKAKWQEVLDRGDPYYNPNFSLDASDYSFRCTTD